MIARHVGVCIPQYPGTIYPPILLLQGSRGEPFSVVDAWDMHECGVQWRTDLKNYDILVSKSAILGADSVHTVSLCLRQPRTCCWEHWIKQGTEAPGFTLVLCCCTSFRNSETAPSTGCMVELSTTVCVRLATCATHVTGCWLARIWGDTELRLGWDHAACMSCCSSEMSGCEFTTLRSWWAVGLPWCEETKRTVALWAIVS